MKAKLLAVCLLCGFFSVSLHATIPAPTKSTQQSLESGKINLNKVDALVLAGSFKGIGQKRAQAIIAYRDAHQGFKSFDELAQVKGIGKRFVEKNKAQLLEVFTL